MSTQVTTEQQQSKLKELIAKGKEQGFLTYGEVNDHLPDDISDPEQIEDIIRMINDMGITVYETAPDADDLLTNEENTADELAAEEAAAALAAVETKQVEPRTQCVCIREMGTVELLTREGEIAIAKRIEEGIRDVLDGFVCAQAQWNICWKPMRKWLKRTSWPTCWWAIWIQPSTYLRPGRCGWC